VTPLSLAQYPWPKPVPPLLTSRSVFPPWPSCRRFLSCVKSRVRYPLRCEADPEVRVPLEVFSELVEELEPEIVSESQWLLNTDINQRFSWSLYDMNRRAKGGNRVVHGLLTAAKTVRGVLYHKYLRKLMMIM
jgi:hypothetical protein